MPHTIMKPTAVNQPEVVLRSMTMWSRKGSNLRPRSYQDRALPLSYDSVEPGRVERPTSAMPWRRSSRLSYGPGGTCGGASLCLTHSLPLCW